MGRDEWDLAHDHEANDHAHDDDREWFVEVFGHVILFLAAIGALTLAPWIFSALLAVLGLFVSLFAGIVGLLGKLVGLLIAAVGLVVGLALSLVALLLALALSPVGLLIVLLILVMRRSRERS